MSLPLPYKCNHDRCKETPPSFLTKSKLVKHLKDFHIDQMNESIVCPENGCDKSFNSVTAFSQHLSKRHDKWRSIELGNNSELTNQDPQPQNMDAEEKVQQQNTQLCTPSAETSTLQQQATIQVANNIAVFYLQLESESLVPASTVQKIYNGVQKFSSLSHVAISEVLIQDLKGVIPDRDLDNLLLRVKANDPIHSAHHKHNLGPELSTNHLRKAYYKKHFQYVEHEEYIVGPDQTMTERTVAYVSIKRNLENMLQDPSVQKQVDASFVEDIPETRSYNTVIRNYTDGSIYIKRARDYGQKRFCIVLFADGFDPASNSSRSGNRYKSVAMYMSLLNLKPSSRSKLSSVRLVMLVFNEVLKNYRTECFSFVINELKNLLSNGIFYKGDKVPVTLEKIAGDNLGQHMIGGFLECFHPSIEYPCRYCDITNNVYIKKPWILGQKRTPESYNNCVLELQNLIERLTVTGKLKEEKVYSVKGIKQASEFNEVPLFHVCLPHLSPCIGHDGFGGTWEYDMAMMIAYFVNSMNWFTYELLNNRIKYFKFFGSDSTNVPAAVSDSGEKLGGNEVQNWTLIRLFVFFVGDLILETSDPVWQLYLQLKCFIEYVCAPALTLEQISNMKFLSTEYLKARSDKNLPLNMKTTSKTHYTAHFADLYELEGPLCQAWTLRFESKHAVLGRAVDMGRTHVNVISSMAKKEQLYSSFLLTQEMFEEGPYEKKKAIPMVKKNYPSHYQAILEDRVFTVNAEDVKVVSIENQEFREGNYVILKKEKNTVTLGKIMFIICDELSTFFLLEKYLSFPLQDYGIYQVQSDLCAGYELLPYLSSSDCTLQAIYEFNENLCFSLKHAILEESMLDQDTGDL